MAVIKNLISGKTMANDIFSSPLPLWYLYFAAFIFGACIGSFLNVCIYRIPHGQSIISPASSCPACRTPIPPYLNIPILSFFLLRGKCHHCGVKISIRYPIVELITALFALATIIRFGVRFEALYWFVFISVLTIITFIDIDLQIIPDQLSIPGIFIFALSVIIVPGMTIKAMLLGVLVGGGSLYLVAVIYYLLRKEEGMGGGDIKLLAMIGAAIGWKGVFFTIFTGSLAGTLSGSAIMLATRSANPKLRIPFGPYLSIGAILYIFWGDALIHWYLNILS